MIIKMAQYQEKHPENKNFEWGMKSKIVTTGSCCQCYKSFTYNGVEYSLFDNVYIYRDGAKETDIGKIVKIWENPSSKRKVKIVWFFRPSDIRNYLGDYEANWHELFLASGEGVGVSNINSIDAIIDKCNVVCLSHDERNCQPSKSDLREADYYFCSTFDVQRCIISHRFPDVIENIKVEHYLNRSKEQKCISYSKLERNQKPVGPDPAFKNPMDRNACLNSNVDGTTIEFHPLKKRKLLLNSDCTASPTLQKKVDEEIKPDNGMEVSSELDNFEDKAIVNPMLDRDAQTNNNGIVVTGRPSIDEAHAKFLAKPMRNENALTDKKDYKDEAHGNVLTKAMKPEDSKKYKKEVEVTTRRPVAGKRSWFNELPWKEEIERAYETKALVWLGNLDPLHASSEVVDIIWNAFKVKADAKIIPHGSFSNPCYGEAWVVFRSQDAADSVISKLKRECLMLDGRPVVACRRRPSQPVKHCSFPGHLILQNVKLRQSDERNTVSTSHCAQSNTLEFEMAMEWHELQARSELWWKKLHEKQAMEVSDLQNRLEKCER